MVKKLREIYQLKVELKGIRPPIWRRFLVSNSVNLEEFHHAIQVVMGWTNSHLHQFLVGDKRFGLTDPEFDMDWDDELEDETEFKVKDIFTKEKDHILYEYDFGNGWEHKITLEKILPFITEQFLPSCIKGRRGCPPEDVGGVWQYGDFLEKWSDPKNPEYNEMREWAGDSFHPEEFDEKEVNEVLNQVFQNV